MKKSCFGLLILLVASCSTDKTLSTGEQLQKDVAVIDKYVVDNAIANVQQDPSGLRYVITTAGPAGGVKPTITNQISVKYTGKLLSTAAVFDQHLTAVTFPLSGLIQGWQIAFPLFTKGTKATLFIPSGLGYGPTGSTSIPPNSNLLFDVELVDVK